MLANFLDKSKPINFITLLIFFVANYLFTVLYKIDFVLNEFLNNLFYLLIFFTVFFFYNFILSKSKLTRDNSYGYFIFSLLIVSVLPEFINLRSLLLLLIYTLFLRRMYSLRSQKNILQKLFDAGFWLSLLFIFEPSSILFFVLVYAGIYLHDKITLHTLFAPIIGVLAPLLIYFTYLFWYDKTSEFTELFNFAINFDFYSESKYSWFLGTLLFSTLIFAFLKTIETASVNNTFKKSWFLLIINFILATILVLLFSQGDYSEIIFLLFPIAVIFTNGIGLVKKKLLKNILIVLCIVGYVFFRFML